MPRGFCETMINRFAVVVAGALMLTPGVFAQTPSDPRQRFGGSTILILSAAMRLMCSGIRT